LKQKPNPDVYALKKECLGEFERLSEQGHIDLFYGDESRVSLLPCVPYGWQFADEQVFIPSDGHGGVNCFALISRHNQCQAHLTNGKITAAWVSERLDALSLSLRRLTVVVVDNASVHVKAVKERQAVWQERGLFVWRLPTYSPHLNIAEILWRKLKYEWLRPEDYADEDTLRYAVWMALSAVGHSLKIAFSPFKKDTENSLT
jgi:transposase